MRSTVCLVTLAVALLVAGSAAAAPHKGQSVLALVGDRPAFANFGSRVNINYRLMCNVNAWGWSQYGVWGYYRVPQTCPQ